MKLKCVQLCVLVTLKPVLNDHSQNYRKLIFKTNYRLMQDKSIAGCSKGSILQYVRPSLSYHLSLRSLFCLFLSDRFTHVLLCYYFEQNGKYVNPVNTIDLKKGLVKQCMETGFFTLRPIWPRCDKTCLRVSDKARLKPVSSAEN